MVLCLVQGARLIVVGVALEIFFLTFLHFNSFFSFHPRTPFLISLLHISFPFLSFSLSPFF